MTEAEIHLQNLHYFFSTAPQVLGAILAITGAFVVFKIDSLKKEIFGTSEEIIKFFNSSIYRDYFNSTKKIEFQNAHISGRIKDIFLILSDIYPRLKAAYEEENNEHTKMLIGRLYSSCNRNFIVKERLDKFIINTKTTYKINGMLLSILIIAFIFLPQVACGTGYWITLIIGIVITLASLTIIIDYLINSITIGIEKNSHVK